MPWGRWTAFDGEITIFDSRPYITKVRGSGYMMDSTFKHGAFFLVWTEQSKWTDVPVPDDVKDYVDLQRFVKSRARATGIDVTKPFPFLLSGTPAEIRWHTHTPRQRSRVVWRISMRLAGGSAPTPLRRR